ncbi:response regulator [candidate division WWE3 bacterium]|nr:response regulator [candidate division WWE3 bacterium]
MATILLIEDTQPLSELYSYSIGSAGYTVVTASSGVEGLEIIKRQPVDLVLLDIMLPGVNGLNVLKQIKENPETNHIPVIMVSVLEQDAILKQARDAGANGYLFKDHITPDVLVEEVQKYLKTDQPVPSTP